MARRQVFNTRSHELRPNQEGRPSLREQAKRGAFGLYLPLLIEVKEPLDQVLQNVRNVWTAERGDAPMAKLRSHDDFGATLAKHSVTQANMRDMLNRGFQLGKFVERLEKTPEAIGPEYVEVPIERVKWVGEGKRKLAAIIDQDSVGYKALETQAAALEDVLGSARGGNAISVEAPDHVSLATYGRHNDGMGIKGSLRRQAQYMVHDYLRDELEQIPGDPLVLKLGSLTIGRGYSYPLDGIELEPTLPAQVWLPELEAWPEDAPFGVY